MSRERLAFLPLMVATFAIRAIYPDQPIVENYVGRQIPTAMVARNLERGSGFLHPELDTAPFPNLFLVEPPIYAQVVAAIRPIIGFELEPTGRLVSAAATTLAAWGLYGLARRREGPTVALLAVVAFGVFPVMVRFGRAFQPDALMIGFVLAGLRGWDEFEATGDRRWATFGGFVLGTGLALKVTVAWTLIPFVLIVGRWPIRRKVLASVAMLAPAFAWYVHAWYGFARPGSGSLASADNAYFWLHSISPDVWLRFSTYENLGRGLALRSFTPVGFVLGFWGFLACGKVDRLWQGWAIGCSLAILGLAAKWHHAYYWMVVAPPAAVGVARGLVGLARSSRPVAAILGSFFLALCPIQSASTWRTPAEWASVVESARVVESSIPEAESGDLIAPEALIYYSDRRGFRLEFDPEAARRAAGEWGRNPTNVEGPMALVEFYLSPERGRRGKKGRHVADVGPTEREPRRRAWRDAIRRSPGSKILVDRPDFFFAELR